MKLITSSWIVRFNSSKMSILPNNLQIHVVPVKIKMGHFIELDKPILKYTWKFQEPRIAKTLVKNWNKVGEVYCIQY